MEIPFTLTAGPLKEASQGFTFEVTSGSMLSFEVTENVVTDENYKGVSIHQHEVTTAEDGSQTWSLGYLLDGTVAVGDITTGTAIGFTFTNMFAEADTPSVIDPPPGGSGDDPYDGPYSDDPETQIDDPDVPLAEPEIPTEEPTNEPIEIDDPDVPLSDVPGEPVEIAEPQVPLGDAPQTGDSDNAVPFVVLMLLAAAGLTVTRRKFN